MVELLNARVDVRTKFATLLTGRVCRMITLFGLVCFAAAVPAAEMPAAAKATVPAPKLSAKSWVLLDFNTGWVLAQNSGDMRIEPASLSKLMTAYVVFTELRKGTIKLSDSAHVSKKAWRTGGSRMFIKVNSKVSIEDLLKGLIIQSGNDAAVALAEHVAGTEDAFAARMNEAAKALGMENSNFTNATGLPDENHFSSARDLSILAMHIIREFPDYYKWYSQKEFTYNKITQGNRNLLLYRDPTVDGVKTGHTSAAGYCLVGSGVQNSMRLIATVTGTKSPKVRAREVQALLKFGYANYESIKVFDGGNPATQVTAYKGSDDRVMLGVRNPVYATVPRGKGKELKTQLKAPQYVIAPVTAGQPLGQAEIALGEEVLSSVSLVALSALPEGSWWRRIVDSVLLWFE